MQNLAKKKTTFMYLSPVHVFVEGDLVNKGRGIIKYFEVALSCLYKGNVRRSR